MKRILFFDDEPIITKYLIENLQKNYQWTPNGFGEITLVSTPEEIFKRAESESYNLFVLDIMVPIDQIDQIDGKNKFSLDEIEEMQDGENTGVVIAKKIRTLPKYENVPVLFLSARVKPPKMPENADYLEKPVFAQKVSNKMKEMLNNN
jgi:CheY-like chemotaxis protein